MLVIEVRNNLLQKQQISRSVVAAQGVLVASTALEVNIEAVLDIKHLTDVGHAQSFTSVNGQGLGRSDRVLDLSAIEVMLGEIIVVLLGEGHQVDLLHDANSLDEDLENLLLGLDSEALVPKSNVDSGLKSVVEGLSLLVRGKQPLKRCFTYLHAVRCQEQNALEVLELSEEDADKRVSANLMQVSLLEENISLVEKKDSSPGVANI